VTVWRTWINVVESEGGADLSFSVVGDQLVPNAIVEDDVGRTFVIVSVADETMPDALDPNIIDGSAIARPTE
jgi:hypothetical protein